ncbi:MAG: lipoprotein [bacterium]
MKLFVIIASLLFLSACGQKQSAELKVYGPDGKPVQGIQVEAVPLNE